jgi:hypothetical protein
VVSSIQQDHPCSPRRDHPVCETVKDSVADSFPPSAKHTHITVMSQWPQGKGRG